MIASCFKGIQRVADASSELVTLADMKNYLKVFYTNDDTLISGFITAARYECEARLNNSFITTTWSLTLHHFPPYNWSFSSGYDTVSGGYGGYPGNTPGVIRLPYGPLIAVNSIEYVDTSGTTLSLSVNPADGQTRISTGYPGELAPAFGTIWPYTQPTIGGVTITYSAGYGASASNVPPPICTAVMMLAAHYYQQRTGAEIEEPATINNLLDSVYLGGYV